MKSKLNLLFQNLQDLQIIQPLNGNILYVSRFKDNQYFCTIEVLGVSPITLDELTEQHAAQENMSLVELRKVIKAIYPSESEFWVINFKLIE